MLLDLVSLVRTIALLAAFAFLFASSLHGIRAMTIALAILLANLLVSHLLERASLHRLGVGARPAPSPLGHRVGLTLLDAAAAICFATGIVPWRHPFERPDLALIALGFAILGVRAFLTARR